MAGDAGYTIPLHPKRPSLCVSRGAAGRYRNGPCFSCGTKARIWHCLTGQCPGKNPVFAPVGSHDLRELVKFHQGFEQSRNRNEIRTVNSSPFRDPVAENMRETELPERKILKRGGPKRFHPDNNTNIRFSDSIQGPFLQYDPRVRMFANCEHVCQLRS